MNRKNSENHLWFVAVTASALGFLGGLAWMQAGGPKGWLYDYQTLLAGILAVGAAYLTVAAMSKSDESQQNRHDELMGLSLRADRLRARRAAIPYADELNVLAIELKRRTMTPLSTFVFKDPNTREAIEMIGALRADIKTIMRKDSITEAKNMFGSEMYYAFDRVNELLADHAFLDKALREERYFTTAATLSAMHVQYYFQNGQVLSMQVEKFSSHLTRLASHYDTVKIPMS